MSKDYQQTQSLSNSVANVTSFVGKKHSSPVTVFSSSAVGFPEDQHVFPTKQPTALVWNCINRRFMKNLRCNHQTKFELNIRHSHHQNKNKFTWNNNLTPIIIAKEILSTPYQRQANDHNGKWESIHAKNSLDIKLHDCTTGRKMKQKYIKGQNCIDGNNRVFGLVM